MVGIALACWSLPAIAFDIVAKSNLFPLYGIKIAIVSSLPKFVLGNVEQSEQ